MIKKIFLSACLFLSLISFAQEGTSSPYSFYGIGEVKFKGTLESRSMGGLAVEPDSTHINLINPAGFSNLKLTSFTMAGTYSSTNLKTENQTDQAQRSTLDYMAVGLPIGKFGVGFGIMPYSSVGYKIQSMATDPTQSNQRFNGSGGVNKVFFGVGYEIASNFTIGADVHYNFGTVEKNSLEYIVGVSLGSNESNKSELSGTNFNFGTMYQAKINKKLSFYSSLNFSPESTLTAKNTRVVSTVQYNSAFDFVIVDALDPVVTDTKVKIAEKWTIGAGVGEARKWLLGAQVALQDVGDYGNNYNSVNNVVYGKYSKYSLGGYYIPNYSSFSSYAKRITYRGGFKYEKTGLIINSESITDRGLSLGAGLPITGSFSNLNVGLEFGKKGTTSANLTQENYINLSVSFSFNDKWFNKRKFN